MSVSRKDIHGNDAQQCWDLPSLVPIHGGETSLVGRFFSGKDKYGQKSNNGVHSRLEFSQEGIIPTVLEGGQGIKDCNDGGTKREGEGVEAGELQDWGEE